MKGFNGHNGQADSRNSEVHLPPCARFDDSRISIRNCALGLGVFANEYIPAGEFVAGFYGQIYAAARASALPQDAVNHAIQFSAHLWRDSNGAGRFFNHSCEPNCCIDGDFDLLTLRPIGLGEELTWDYSTTENSDWVVPGGKCLCGSTRCRGIIPPFRELSRDEQKAVSARIARWLCSSNEYSSERDSLRT